MACRGLPTYAAQAKVGKVDGFAKPSLEWRRPAAAVVDAKHGFAYPAIDLALDALPKAARQNGIAAAADHALASLRRRRPSG